jgi:hypothetical protein
MAKLRISVKLPEAHIQWEPPPKASSGDADWKPIWQAVGAALSAWEYIEEECALLFSALVESNSEAAYRAYGCVVSNSTKREMLENSAEVFFSTHKIIESDEIYFYDLMKHLQKAASFRNEIAHGAVMGVPTKRGNEYFLLPPIYNSRKTIRQNTEVAAIEPRVLSRAKYRYTAQDVNNLSHKFEWLNRAFTSYRQTTSYWRDQT